METDTIINQAQSEGSFDLLSFVEATAYPTSEVTVYQDAQSATELMRANKERLDKDAKPEKYDPAPLDEKIATLTEKVRKSAIVFELRGMPPGIVQDIYGAEDDERPENERVDDLIAHTVVAARNSVGARDSRLWTKEDVAKLRKFLKEGEFGKLIQGVIDVNFNAMVFDEATDAGFLSRGSDLAV